MPDLGIQTLAVRLARTPFLRLTKAGVLRAVRKHHWPKDGLNQKARVQVVYDLARQIMRVRARRFFARYVRPVPDLRTRLHQWRQRKARAEARAKEPPIQFWVAACHAHFRQARGRRDEHHVHAEVVQHEAEVGACGDYYAISRRRRASEHRFCVPGDWLARVREPGLALLDGRLTLWADRQKDVLRRGHRVEVFRAVWCRQGRRFTLVTERGFISRLGPHVAHAEDPAGAVRAVVRTAEGGGTRLTCREASAGAER
jgi:hypothetical protein